mmetsp:Transcript_1613/g.5893  ORF Transcript_1613/g.5893 Transcript_1613/m.5893 type:complete len:208 (+) Transcript_1613:661-1284(+)
MRESAVFLCHGRKRISGLSREFSFYILSSVVAAAYVIREGEEGRGFGGIVAFELRLGVDNHLVRDALALLEADERGVGGFAHRLVLARRLAELLARLRAVEDVVDYLKREADGLRVAAQSLDVLFARPAQNRTAHHSRLEQGARFVRVDVLQRLEANLFGVPFAHNVHHLSPNQPLTPNALPHVRDDAEHPLRSHAARLTRDVLERV